MILSTEEAISLHRCIVLKIRKKKRRKERRTGHHIEESGFLIIETGRNESHKKVK